jgi:hypothetical protein
MSTFSALFTQSVRERAATLVFDGSFCQLNVKTTSSAVSGSPLWNFTPGRSFTSIVVGLRNVTELARCGLNSPVARSRSIRVSQTCLARTTPSRFVWA